MIKLTFGLALTVPLAAQNLLYVDHGGKPCLVRGARGGRPLIEINGKLVDVEGARFALQKREEYLPVFVSVRNLEVSSHYITMNGGGQMNNELQFSARFETGNHLDDVFIVLEMDTDSAGKVLFFREVGQLDPHKPKPIALTVPLAFPLGNGRFQFHLFTEGAEMVHSEMPLVFREATLDHMVRKRIADVQNAAPRSFIGPVPEYPAALEKQRIEGDAVVAMRISRTGTVVDPEVKSATDPAFGQAALAAIRQWRFLPGVKDGHPAEAKVEMPFHFVPPAKSAK